MKVNLFRSSARILIACALTLVLVSCNGANGGLEAFKSPDGRYGFLYPTGWSRVAVNNGPQVVFHDIIHSDETLSLVVSKVQESIKLEDLGSPMEVGDKLIKEVIAPSGTGRNADLVEAISRESSGHTFYDLEYSVHLKDRDRHELATVSIDRGNLYTLATSTQESRWPKVNGLFDRVIKSFTFLI